MTQVLAQGVPWRADTGESPRWHVLAQMYLWLLQSGAERRPVRDDSRACAQRVGCFNGVFLRCVQSMGIAAINSVVLAVHLPLSLSPSCSRRGCQRLHHRRLWSRELFPRLRPHPQGRRDPPSLGTLVRLDQLWLLWMVVVSVLMKCRLLRLAAWAWMLRHQGSVHGQSNQWSRGFCCNCRSVFLPLALRWLRRCRKFCSSCRSWSSFEFSACWFAC